MTEDYVSFETAKLLEDKGFDKPCLSHYEVNNKQQYISDSEVKNSDFELEKGKCISAPTLQMAMKWLREVHEIFIRPNTSFLYPIRYYCEIFCYGDNLKTQQDITTENFESPEEACEAAIKYCLENLV